MSLCRRVGGTVKPYNPRTGESPLLPIRRKNRVWKNNQVRPAGEAAGKALEGPQAHAIGLCWCITCLRLPTRCNGFWQQ